MRRKLRSLPNGAHEMRLKAHERKQAILDAIVPVCRTRGYQAVGWEDAARAADVSVSLVRKYFGTLNQFHRAIISHAIANRDPRIVAQGIAAGDSKAKRAPAELVAAAARIIMGK